ncbi:hypothetical protein DICVIV_09736 [Dictyocaulus viviparus]|uniref:Uncharacterized protein n=1 Tax=Dictyocaulus viviparus TaxID=29172 RepID=A0A0D8XHV2_DICVI|nr:hypothetical protein DICVIV_09736 [Dictyocaulus viviparus]
MEDLERIKVKLEGKQYSNAAEFAYEMRQVLWRTGESAEDYAYRTVLSYFEKLWSESPEDCNRSARNSTQEGDIKEDDKKLDHYQLLIKRELKKAVDLLREFTVTENYLNFLEERRIEARSKKIEAPSVPTMAILPAEKIFPKLCITDGDILCNDSLISYTGNLGKNRRNTYLAAKEACFGGTREPDNETITLSSDDECLAESNRTLGIENSEEPCTSQKEPENSSSDSLNSI